MRSLQYLIRRCFIFFISSGFCSIASAQSNTISPEAPKFITGESWKFKKIELPSNKSSIQVQKVLAVDENNLAWIFIENLTSGYKVWWLFDGSKGAAKSTFAYDPSKNNFIGKKLSDNLHESRIQFPLHQGKKYKITEYWNEKKTGKTDYQITVIGIEKVVTEAGEFMTWKLVADGVWIDKTNDSTGQTKAEMWYSPEVKRWVKTRFIGTAEGRQPNVTHFELIEWKKGD